MDVGQIGSETTREQQILEWKKDKLQQDAVKVEKKEKEGEKR